MFGRDELVLHAVSDVGGLVQHLHGLRRNGDLHAGSTDLRDAIEFAIDHVLKLTEVDANLVEQRTDDTLFFVEQRLQQVQRFDVLMLGGLSHVLRTLECFLSFDGEFVGSKCHGVLPKLEVGAQCGRGIVSGALFRELHAVIDLAQRDGGID